MIIVILASFVVCWLPFHVDKLIEVANYERSKNDPSLYLGDSFSNINNDQVPCSGGSFEFEENTASSGSNHVFFTFESPLFRIENNRRVVDFLQCSSQPFYLHIHEFTVQTRFYQCRQMVPTHHTFVLWLFLSMSTRFDHTRESFNHRAKNFQFNKLYKMRFSSTDSGTIIKNDATTVDFQWIFQM